MHKRKLVRTQMDPKRGVRRPEGLSMDEGDSTRKRKTYYVTKGTTNDFRFATQDKKEQRWLTKESGPPLPTRRKSNKNIYGMTAPEEPCPQPARGIVGRTCHGGEGMDWNLKREGKKQRKREVCSSEFVQVKKNSTRSEHVLPD